MRARAAGLAAALAAAFLAAGPAAHASALQPHQMVRSLQLVQDRIAGGDHAALPMQNKLLEMIDARLREASAAEFADRRNFRALLIYAMSGGNPVTIEVVLTRIHLEEEQRALGNGVLGYVQGQPRAAMATLADVDPMAQGNELGAFLALVRGSLMANEDPPGALASLDRARLMAPGTLVEEAALRRSVALTAELGEPARFLRVSSQYVRRFLRSPYASQFADAFVGGIVALHETLDAAALAETIGAMSPEQQNFIYLRLARIGAIDGIAELSDFAIGHLREIAGDRPLEDDPRALLYSSLGSVTSETVFDVLERLKSIDRAGLAPNDRRLLDAAAAIAEEVTLSPVAPRGEAAEDDDAEAARPDATEALISSAREKLGAIDALLGER